MGLLTLGGGGGSGIDAVARAAINAMRADIGDVVQPGHSVKALDSNNDYRNNTLANITLTGENAADLVADGLEPFTASSASTEVLTIVSVNTINNLANTPTGGVDFHVNGILVSAGGITNTGLAITVNAALLGYNIALTDNVTATYSS